MTELKAVRKPRRRRLNDAVASKIVEALQPAQLDLTLEAPDDVQKQEREFKLRGSRLVAPPLLGAAKPDLQVSRGTIDCHYQGVLSRYTVVRVLIGGPWRS